MAVHTRKGDRHFLFCFFLVVGSSSSSGRGRGRGGGGGGRNIIPGPHEIVVITWTHIPSLQQLPKALRCRIFVEQRRDCDVEILRLQDALGKQCHLHAQVFDQDLFPVVSTRPARFAIRVLRILEPIAQRTRTRWRETCPRRLSITDHPHRERDGVSVRWQHLQQVATVRRRNARSHTFWKAAFRPASKLVTITAFPSPSTSPESAMCAGRLNATWSWNMSRSGAIHQCWDV